MGMSSGTKPAGPASATAAPRWRRAIGCVGEWLRRRFAFDSRGNVVAACVAASVLCGLWSLWRGQDANWDLRNYHLYNGYAALGGRLSLDLAAAQLQSYFHPLLDILQYSLLTGWPAPLVGFALGALHGWVFALVAAIGWLVLADDPRRATRVPLLALAALASGAFVSELGNTMADNTTALPVLAALACVLRAQGRQRTQSPGALLAWSLAGVLIGLAVALKLTNALYAGALGLAALADGGPWRRRLAGTVIMTAVALLVFVAVGGTWFWKVWQAFGNPLFPQFNAWFQAPLATAGAVSDTRFLPKSLGQWLAWPLLFTIRPWRVSEIALPQLLWATLYLSLVVGLALKLLRRAPKAVLPAAPAGRVLFVFVGVAYLLWQSMFSIHRYLVAIEVLVPLLLWWLWPRLLPASLLRARGPVLLVCVLGALGGGRDWGHEPWRAQAFEVPAPAIPAPAHSAVVMMGGNPQGWRIPFLPAEAAYLSVGSNFPASPAYYQRVAQMLQARPQRYAMLEAVVDRGADRVVRLNDWARRFGWDRQADCAMLRRAVRWGVRAVLDDSTPGHCVLLQRPNKRIDIAAGDAQLRAEAAAQLAPLGWQLEEASCERRPAWIGATLYPYQWCRLRPLP